MPLQQKRKKKSSPKEDISSPPKEKKESHPVDKDESVERFIQTLQWLMDDRKMSEAELSRLTNLAPATIHRLIYGITDPRLSTLRAIASFFKIRIEQLTGDYPIPSITQINNESSDKVFFSTPILIPFIEWDEILTCLKKNSINNLTMSNWSHWHATTSELQADHSSDFFATKLSYTAGNLLPAESVLIIKHINNTKEVKIGDCVIGANENGMAFVGQVSGSGDEIIIKGGASLHIKKLTLFGIVIKCETPFEKICRYTHLI